MMLDWNEYQKQIAANTAQIGRANHEIIKGYRGLSEAGNATNLLGPKVRELIALAVAVTRQCDGCIITHTDAAIKHGATKEEILLTSVFHLYKLSKLAKGCRRLVS